MCVSHYYEQIHLYWASCDLYRFLNNFHYSFILFPFQQFCYSYSSQMLCLSLVIKGRQEGHTGVWNKDFSGPLPSLMQLPVSPMWALSLHFHLVISAQVWSDFCLEGELEGLSHKARWHIRPWLLCFLHHPQPQSLLSLIWPFLPRTSLQLPGATSDVSPHEKLFTSPVGLGSPWIQVINIPVS